MRKIHIILIAMMFILSGCAGNSTNTPKVNKEVLPDVFGAELNSLSYVEFEDSMKGYYLIEFMSRIDVGNYDKVEIEFLKGQFEYTVSILPTEYVLDDYIEYTLEINADNPVYENGKIEVSKICIFPEDCNEPIELIPQLFEIELIEGEWEHESWAYTRAPLSYPVECDSFHFGMEVNENVEISKVSISNDSFVFVNESEFINAKWGVQDSSFDIDFRIKETELSKYTKYVTDVVIWYDVNDKTYIKRSMANITYNPFTGYDDLFGMYYNDVILKR